MPTPFHCHSCDKPTMNNNMICDDCNKAYIEGDKAIFATVTDLERKIQWLENGLNEIKATTKGLLDGEPTTADEHNCMIQYDDPFTETVLDDENVVRISDVNKEIAEEWDNSVGEVLSENTMQEDEKENYEDEHTCKHGNSLASNCSDCDDEETKDYRKSLKGLVKKYPNDQALGSRVRSMVTCLGYRGED